MPSIERDSSQCSPGLLHQLLSPWPAQHPQSGSFTPDRPIPAHSHFPVGTASGQTSNFRNQADKSDFQIQFQGQIISFTTDFSLQQSTEPCSKKKTPAENNLKFVIEKSEEREKGVGKKMRWYFNEIRREVGI